MNIKKKAIALLLLLLYSLNIQTVDADVSTYSNTTGYSKESEWDACGGTLMNGCANWGDDLYVRVSLIDPTTNKMVEGTKAVEFEPLNPYTDDSTYETTPTPFVTQRDAVVKSFKDKLDQNSNYDQMFYFYWSSYASPLAGLVDTTRYIVPFGYGKNDYVDVDFSNYNDMRKIFINNVTSLDKDIYIEELGKKISFIDFFLKTCGYADTWQALENSNVRKKIIERDYYLAIEPMYWMYTVKNGHLHKFEGTAKQISVFIEHWGADEQDWFWPLWSTEINYNFMCGFVDYNENFYNNSRYADGVTYTNAYISLCKDTTTYDKTDGYLYAMKSYINNRLGALNSGFGVNTINLSEIATTLFEEKKESLECTYDVDSCLDDSFYYSAKLTSKMKKNNATSYSQTDTLNCVFPTTPDATEKQSDYVYHDSENDLWCYDDVTYDFTKIKKSFENKTIFLSTLLEIPKGNLNVTRTCYSKKSPDALREKLDTVYVNDPGTYQDNIKLKINDRTYTYKRENEKKLTTAYQSEYKTSGKNYKVTKITETAPLYFYKYTSSFDYAYSFKSIDDNNDISIGINDLSIENSYASTNSVEFIKKYNDSNLITTRSEGTRSIETKPTELITNLNNAYGISNKLYNKINPRQTGVVENVNLYRGMQSFKTESIVEKFDKTIITQYTTTYDVSKDEKQSCSFDTTIEDRDIYGDGLIFRTISLTNPFPARDGTSRIAGENWINQKENNVYNYIEKNRNVNTEEVYNKEPLYKITLTPSIMTSIREYNKSHSYNDYNIKCEEGTGRMCLSEFLRNNISTLEGTCSTINVEEVTKINKEIKEFEDSKCNEIQACLYGNREKVQRLDHNGDGKVTEADYINADFYKCADKTASSGGPNK